MAAPTRADRTAAFLRTFAIQGSWNYRTLIGAGLAYAMLPMLMRIHAGNPVALRESLLRHASSFNGHPYLSAMAVGALSRVEHEGLDPATIERFRTALRAPLGALGDRAVWAGWRPACLLLAIIAFALGLEGWKAAVLFLAVYNVGHLWIRAWAFRRGWETGLDIGSVLTSSFLDETARWLVRSVQVLLGAAVVLVLLQLPGPEPLGILEGAAALVVGLLAYCWPLRGGTAGVALLAAAVILWLI